ncbi:MAG: tetratricopeptide repeat protein [Desulfuromonadaceae bacterium]|nr:tetratricopeptide repeat protein [Desulfuromonadaceae bacterium]
MQLIILSTFLLLSACTIAPHSSDAPLAAPVILDNHSHSLYLFSRARLTELEGDYPAALSLLHEAMTFESDSATLYGEAAALKYKIGQVPEALDYIKKAIALDPGYRPPYLLGGVILSSAGKDIEAAKYLRKAIAIDPDKEDGYLHLAMSLNRLFEYAEAVATLKELTKRNPDSALGYYYLGRTYSQMKLYHDALGYFTKVLSLKPGFDLALIDMAATYEALGDYSHAIDTYRSLFEQDERRTPILQRLIQLLLQQQRFGEALDYLKQAAQEGLGGQETLRKIGLVHLELEQFKEAIAVFSDLLDDDPLADNIRLYRGIAYEENGDLDKAYADFTCIKHDSAQYIEALSHAALILKEQGNIEAAIGTFRDAIAENRGTLELYLNLSTLYESIDKPQAGLDFLLESEPLFQKEPRLHFRIGVLFDKLGQRTESINRMKLVLQLDPNDPQALNYLGYSYAEMGIHLEEALQYIQKAVALRPRDAFILDSLGWAYFKLKRYDEAVNTLREAISLVDDDSTIVEHLGDVYAARHAIKKALKQYQRALELTPERKELVEKMHKLKGEQSDK